MQWEECGDHDMFAGPGVNAEKLGTADTWLGQQAVALGIADLVQTSDAYLHELAKSNLVKVLSSKAVPENPSRIKVLDALLAKLH